MGKPRALIADDESVIRMDVREMLTEAGYEVVGEAATGEEAVAKARSERPDVAIVDIKMPGMDGIDAARTLIEEAICPVVLLTAYGQPELVARAKDAGIFGYVTKPFEERDLLPAIEMARARYDEIAALKGQVSTLEEAIETRKLVDRAKGILMDSYGLKEGEAHRRIQQESMNRRKSMREIAEAIIMAREVSEGKA
jgi:AmiR/NasT family two-component response regulator